MKVLIVLPPLASIRVKLARQLQVDGLTRVRIALVEAWAEVNSNDAPFLLVYADKEEVTV